MSVDVAKEILDHWGVKGSFIVAFSFNIIWMVPACTNNWSEYIDRNLEHSSTQLLEVAPLQALGTPHPWESKNRDQLENLETLAPELQLAKTGVSPGCLAATVVGPGGQGLQCKDAEEQLNYSIGFI